MYAASLSQDLLVQSAYLLTCGTIHLSSVIWFDCFPPASVSANSPQCDFVVWHKVMKTYKALITCQRLWSEVLADLCSRSHTRGEAKTAEEYASTYCAFISTQLRTLALTRLRCSLNYPAVISPWLMVPFLMVSMISSHWRCNFSSSRVRMGCVAYKQPHIHIEYSRCALAIIHQFHQFCAVDKYKYYLGNRLLDKRHFPQISSLTDTWELTSVVLLLILRHNFSCWSLIDFCNSTLTAVITQTETGSEFLYHVHWIPFACQIFLSASLLVQIINLQEEKT